MLNIANTCLIVINYSTIFSSQRECCCIHRLYHAISCHDMLFCMLEVSIQTPKVKLGWPHKWLSWVWVQIGGPICFHLGFYNSNLKWNPQRKPFQTSYVKIHHMLVNPWCPNRLHSCMFVSYSTSSHWSPRFSWCRAETDFLETFDLVVSIFLQVFFHFWISVFWHLFLLGLIVCLYFC